MDKNLSNERDREREREMRGLLHKHANKGSSGHTNSSFTMIIRERMEQIF